MRKYMHHHVHQHNINHWGGWPTNCHLKKGVNIIGLGPCPHKVVPCSATPASNKLGWSNKEIIGKNQQWTSDPIADFTWFNIFHPQPTTTSTLSSFSICLLFQLQVPKFCQHAVQLFLAARQCWKASSTVTPKKSNGKCLFFVPVFWRGYINYRCQKKM